MKIHPKIKCKCGKLVSYTAGICNKCLFESMNELLRGDTNDK